MQSENEITPELLAIEDNVDSFELDINAVFALQSDS